MDSYTIEGRVYAAHSLKGAKLAHVQYLKRAQRLIRQYEVAVCCPEGGPLVTTECKNLRVANNTAAEFVANGASSGMVGYTVTITDLESGQNVMEYLIKELV